MPDDATAAAINRLAGSIEKLATEFNHFGNNFYGLVTLLQDKAKEKPKR